MRAANIFPEDPSFNFFRSRRGTLGTADGGTCVPECPVEANFHEENVPDPMERIPRTQCQEISGIPVGTLVRLCLKRGG